MPATASLPTVALLLTFAESSLARCRRDGRLGHRHACWCEASVDLVGGPPAGISFAAPGHTRTKGSRLATLDRRSASGHLKIAPISDRADCTAAARKSRSPGSVIPTDDNGTPAPMSGESGPGEKPVAPGSCVARTTRVGVAGSISCGSAWIPVAAPLTCSDPLARRQSSTVANIDVFHSVTISPLEK